MKQLVSDEQIQSACAALLRSRRHVTVVDVVGLLYQRHKAQGKNNRIGPILEALRKATPLDQLGRDYAALVRGD